MSLMPCLDGAGRVVLRGGMAGSRQGSARSCTESRPAPQGVLSVVRHTEGCASRTDEKEAEWLHDLAVDSAPPLRVAGPHGGGAETGSPSPPSPSRPCSS